MTAHRKEQAIQPVGLRRAGSRPAQPLGARNSRGWSELRHFAELSIRLERSLREDNGSALIEFAASAVLLFTMIFGIMDFSRAVYIDHFVANAAQEATRYASVRGASWSSTCASAIAYSCTASSSNVSSFVQSLATPGVNAANLVTTTTWPGTTAAGSSCTSSGSANSAGCLVMVRVAYSFSFVLPLLPKNALALSSTSEVTIAE